MKPRSFLISIVILLFFASCESEEINYSGLLRYSNAVFDSIIHTRNIHYKTAKTISGKSKKLYLDFYQPYGDSLDYRPLVILIHGGGFVQGKREWMDSLAFLLPHFGYSCANISYRLYDRDNFPMSNEEFLESVLIAREDLISAVDYFIAHASGLDPYKTDVNNIFLAGVSAGAIACLHAIPLKLSECSDSFTNELWMNNKDLQQINELSGPEADLRGIISFSGAILDTNWIDNNYPPVFCVHGTNDNIVPFSDGEISINDFISPIPAYGSEMICKIINENGQLARLIADVGAGHDNYFKKSELWTEEAIVFLKDALVLGKSP